MIASEALAILENELGFLNRVHRAYEDEFTEKYNGYSIGSTLTIRRPADFTVRSGATMSLQDVIEGKVTFTVDQQKGVDFQFTSTELTLGMEGENGFSERVLKPAMSSLLNEVCSDVLETMYAGLWNWAGTPGELINSAADFVKGTVRANHMLIPMAQRTMIMGPDDHGALLGSQTALFIAEAAKSAYRDAELGRLLGVETYMSQVTPTHTAGTRTNTTPLVDGASQSVSFDTAKDTYTSTLLLKGAGNAVTYKAGDVFTIANVFMVNARTKDSTAVLQNFRVTTLGTTTAGGAVTLTIQPPIIISGPHQTVNAAAADGAAITNIGTASTGYVQNMLFHKNAMALAFVPMVLPAGAVNPVRKSTKGMSVRFIPVYDGVNDNGKFRMDVLYGRKVIDGRLGLRLSGTA